MSQPKRNIMSAVGKRAISSITGLLLTVFLIFHLAGNLLLLRGHGEIFNVYANALGRVPILLLIELVLVGLFAYHAWMGLKVYFENKAARPDGYAGKQWTKRGASRKTISSSTMHLSGAAVLLFLLLHIWHFKFGETLQSPTGRSDTTYLSEPGFLNTYTGSPSLAHEGDYERPTLVGIAGGTDRPRDLALLVVTEFKKPLIVALYLLSLFLVGLHLNHGFSSAFQTLGASRLSKRLLIGGRVFTALLIGGFMFIPLWILFAWN